MLRDITRQTHREIISQDGPVQPIATVTGIRTAANESSIGQSETQARRQRRASRMQSTGRVGNVGWNIRTW